MKRIHLFNGFHNPYGGSELEALGLYHLLRERADVRLWATSSRASQSLTRKYPIERPGWWWPRMPAGGTYVFVGAHWRKGLWPYRAARPDRLIYVYNTFHPRVTELTSRPRPMLGWPAVEYVFISDFQRRRLGLDGVVHPSPIDIEAFVPAERPSGGPLAIGRLSRDIPDKFDDEDVELFRELAAAGHDVRLQGATCLASRLAAPNLTVTAEGAEPARTFLQGLDIFYYRTGTHVETFGRVVFEAMACALPVVCHRRGGYADWIRHGENGFLFDTTAEARQLLSRLIADAELRRRIGAAARKTVETMYGEGAVEERAAFYLA